MNYYVVGIYDCSSHANKPLFLYEVEAEDENKAIEEAFNQSPYHLEYGLSYSLFHKKIGHRFAVNTILI